MQIQLEDEEEMQYVKDITNLSATANTTNPKNISSQHPPDDVPVEEDATMIDQETTNDPKGVSPTSLPSTTWNTTTLSTVPDNDCIRQSNKEVNPFGVLDNLDDELNKFSESIVDQLQTKHGSQHIRFRKDDNNKIDVVVDPKECSMPLSRKRRLRSNSGGDNPTKNHTSPEHEMVVEDDDDQNATADDNMLMHQPSTSSTSKMKRQRIREHEDRDDMDCGIIETTNTKKNSVTEKGSLKRNDNQGTTSVEAGSKKTIETAAYMSVVEACELDTVLVPLHTKPPRTPAPTTTTTTYFGSMIQSVVQSTKKMTALIHKKISSPDRNNNNDQRNDIGGTSKRARLFNGTPNRCFFNFSPRSLGCCLFALTSYFIVIRENVRRW